MGPFSGSSFLRSCQRGFRPVEREFSIEGRDWKKKKTAKEFLPSGRIGQGRNFEADLQRPQWKISNHFPLLEVGPGMTEICPIGGRVEKNPGIFFDGPGGIEIPRID